MPKSDPVDRLLELLAESPKGELSTVLHLVHKIPADVLEEALARGFVRGTIEPISNVRHPPVRLFITRAGLTLLDLARV